MCSGLRGLRVLPGVKVASSVVTVLPMMTAPARRSAVTQAASAVGWRPLWARQPFSVGMSAVSMMSLMPIGHPVQRPDALALLAQRLGGARLRQRPLGVEELPGLHLGLEGGDAVEAGADQLLELVSPRAIRGPPGRGEVGEVGIGQGVFPSMCARSAQACASMTSASASTSKPKVAEPSGSRVAVSAAVEVVRQPQRHAGP